MSAREAAHPAVISIDTLVFTEEISILFMSCINRWHLDISKVPGNQGMDPTIHEVYTLNNIFIYWTPLHKSQ